MSPLGPQPRADGLTIFLLALGALGLGVATGIRDGLYSTPAILTLSIAVAAILAAIFLRTPRLATALAIASFLSGGALAIWSRVALRVAERALEEANVAKAALWANHAAVRLNLCLAALLLVLLFSAGRLRRWFGDPATGAPGAEPAATPTATPGPLAWGLLALVAASFAVLLVGRPGTAHHQPWYPDLQAGDVAPWSQPGLLLQLGARAAAQAELAGLPTTAPVGRAAFEIESRRRQLAAALRATTWQVALLGVAAAAALAIVARWRIASLSAAGAHVGFWRWTGALALAATLAGHVALGAWVIRHDTPPYIDVWHFQQEACRALLAGRNPYAIDMPNIYGPDNFTYSPELRQGERVAFGYPYPPLSLYLSLPGYLLGDVRFAHLGAVALAALLLALSGPGVRPLLGGLLLLSTSRLFMVVEVAWTEPLVVLFLALVVFCARRAPWALPWALGLLLASKQYMVLAVPLAALLVLRPWTWRNCAVLLAKAALVALAVSLPLVFFEPPGQFAPTAGPGAYQRSAPAAFLHSAVTLQIGQPMRHDALSYVAWYFWYTLPLERFADRDYWPSHAEMVKQQLGWLAFPAAAMGIAVSLWRWPRGAGGFAAAVATTYLLFLVTNKQAFANYYFLVVAALCAAVAALPQHAAPRQTAQEPPATSA